MTRLLLKKYVRESALLFAACAVMLLAFCWVRVWIMCQFDLQQFEPLLEQLRPFEKYSPVPLEQFLTYSGSLAMTFHEPVLILCILVWAIARGSDVVSGEIDRGTLEMLLAQPIGRVQLLYCHAAVCMSGLGLLCFIAWLGLVCGIHTNSIREKMATTVEVGIPFLPVKIPLKIGTPREVETPLADRVDPAIYLAPTCNLFGFGAFVWAFSVMCSSFDRYRWRTLGIVITFYVMEVLLFLLCKAAPQTSFLGYFSFLSAYQPDSIVHFARNSPERGWWIHVPADSSTSYWPHWLGPLGMTLMLLALGLLFFAIAAWRFRSRDIPAPL